jgi:hypothetical protein
MQSYGREVVPGLDGSQSFEDRQARNGKLVTQVSPTQGRITSSRAARDRGAPGGVRPVGHVVVGDPPTTTVVEAIPDRGGPDHAARLLAIHPCQPEDLVAEIDRLHAELPPKPPSRGAVRETAPPRRRHRGGPLAHGGYPSRSPANRQASTRERPPGALGAGGPSVSGWLPERFAGQTVGRLSVGSCCDPTDPAGRRHGVNAAQPPPPEDRAARLVS